MFLYPLLVLLLHPCFTISKIKDLSDEEHYPGGEHDPEFDHEAFLGVDTAQHFHELPLEESKERLGEIFHKVDEQLLADGFVTEEELGKWIQYTKKRSNLVDAEKQVKKNDINEDGSVSWEEYKKVTYGYLNENNDENNEYHVESLKHDEKRFKLADQEGDMKLDIKEFSAFLHPEDDEHMVAHMVNGTIEDMDKNDDGFVSVEEYLGDLDGGRLEGGVNDGEPDWLKTERKQFTEFHDKNKDGRLDGMEVKEWILPHDYVTSEAKHLIEESDSDGDGKISKQEMVEKYNLFVGSQVTDFGDIITSHEEL